MNKQLFFKHCATLGPIGYTLTPGTTATLATMPLVVQLGHFSLTGVSWFFICVLTAVLSVMCIQYALPLFGKVHDPSAVVLDEVVGTLVTFCGIPFSYGFLGMGIMLFRLFDVRKPFFIKWAEEFPGAVGIVADDVVAGLAANVVLRLMMYWL